MPISANLYVGFRADGGGDDVEQQIRDGRSDGATQRLSVNADAYCVCVKGRSPISSKANHRPARTVRSLDAAAAAAAVSNDRDLCSAVSPAYISTSYRPSSIHTQHSVERMPTRWHYHQTAPAGTN